MNRLCKSLMVLEFAVAAGLSAVAVQKAVAADQTKPDLNRGQTIATQVCAACHGADGNSAGGAYPKLAGQHPEYLVKQLHDFKPAEGKPAARSNPIMAGFAGALSDQDMQNVAAYFAAQAPKPGYAHNASTIALGQKIYRGGDAERGVPACAACHGPTGQGIPTQYRGSRVSGPSTSLRSSPLSSRARAITTNRCMRCRSDCPIARSRPSPITSPGCIDSPRDSRRVRTSRPSQGRQENKKRVGASSWHDSPSPFFAVESEFE